MCCLGRTRALVREHGSSTKKKSRNNEYIMGSHGGKIPSIISLLQNLKTLTTPKVWSIKPRSIELSVNALHSEAMI